VATFELSLARLRELTEIGRRYELFAQANPSEAIVQIAELNEPGRREHAWDLQWVPKVLRAKIARVSSILVLELCRMPGDPNHDPALMDVIMRAAIVAACTVADSYGIAPEIPRGPLTGHLEILARLLHRLTLEKPDELEKLGKAHATALANPQLLIATCLPTRVRDRLIGLVNFMAEHFKIVDGRIGIVVLTIGAVASETFDALSFSDNPLGPLLPSS
jgi:hypothetical protein